MSMENELQYYPKGGRCSACANKWQDCSNLDFKRMPVYRKDEFGVCVICTHFIKEER